MLVLFPDLCCSRKYSRILTLSELKERHTDATWVDTGNWGGERALGAMAIATQALQLSAIPEPMSR